MNQEEFNEKYEKHLLYLKSDENGKRLSCTNINLSNIDFTHLNLSYVTFENVIFKCADFEYANLTCTNLKSADFEGANLKYVDFTHVDLKGANLEGADLRGANLEGANLEGANIDFSCLPLWCGGLNIKIDKRIAVQLTYHLCSMQCNDIEFQEIRKMLLPFANQMHRTDVPRLE